MEKTFLILILAFVFSIKLYGQDFDIIGKWLSNDAVYVYDFDVDNKTVLVVKLSSQREFLAEFELIDHSLLKIKREDGNLFQFKITVVSDNEVEIEDLQLGEKRTFYQVLNDDIEFASLPIKEYSIPIRFSDSITYMISSTGGYKLNHKYKNIREVDIDIVQDECVTYFLIDGFVSMYILNFDKETIETIRPGEGNKIIKYTIQLNPSLDDNIHGEYEAQLEEGFCLKNAIILKTNQKVNTEEIYEGHGRIKKYKNKGKWVAYKSAAILEIGFKKSSSFYHLMKKDGKYFLTDCDEGNHDSWDNNGPWFQVK